MCTTNIFFVMIPEHTSRQQDTIQLIPLGLTMFGMMLRNPGAIARVLLQVRGNWK
jgi:hypothetical protein